MASAVEWSFGVGTVGISMTVMSKMKIIMWYLIRKTFVNIWKWKVDRKCSPHRMLHWMYFKHKHLTVSAIFINLKSYWCFEILNMEKLPLQMTPSPEYPVWHVQWNDPLVLVQFASTWQLSIFVAHSSISEMQVYQFWGFYCFSSGICFSPDQKNPDHWR